MSRWTQADVDRVNAAQSKLPASLANYRKSSKYSNEATGGYASKREAERAQALLLDEKLGEIRHLAFQVKFVLIPRQTTPSGLLRERECSYIADFVYDMRIGPNEWKPVVEDCKGFRTDVYRIKRKLMLKVHGIRIRET